MSRAIVACRMRTWVRGYHTHTNTCTHLLDGTVIVWNLLREEGNYGVAKRALRGHNHFVSDVVVSSDGMFALSGSWDATLRLWDLQT